MFTTINEKKFFLSHINPNHSILEYGSGESTLEISKLCFNLVSVEHQYNWYEKIKTQISNKCTLLFHPPDIEYLEGDDCGNMEQFFTYVHSPLPYAPFDIILIDGRARVSCCSIVNNLVRNKSSLIFIHDWNRVEYQKALDYLNLIDICETMGKFIIK